MYINVYGGNVWFIVLCLDEGKIFLSELIRSDECFFVLVSYGYYGNVGYGEEI